MLQDNSDDARKAAELLTGQLLVAAAITLQGHYKRAVSQSYPPASKPGEYPKWRTGTGREATGYEPDDPKEVGEAGVIRVGWSLAGNHMGILEAFRGRKGLRAAAAEIAGQLQALIGGIPKP